MKVATHKESSRFLILPPEDGKQERREVSKVCLIHIIRRAGDAAVRGGHRAGGVQQPPPPSENHHALPRHDRPHPRRVLCLSRSHLQDSVQSEDLKPLLI